MQPGESAKIPIKMSAAHFSGHLAKTIMVSTNAPGAAATITLKVEGDVWQAVEIKPPNATFGRLTADAAKDPTRVQKLTIVNNLEEEAKLTDVRSTNPAFGVQTSVKEAGKEFELAIRIASAPQVGNVAGTIELSTGIKEMPTLSVPVSVYITPDLEVMPPNLTLPQDLPTASNRQLYILNNATTPVKISDVQCNNPDIKVALEELAPGMKFKLIVDLPAGYKTPATGDKITFKTDSPTSPEMIVSIGQTKSAPSVPAPASKTAPAASTVPRKVGAAAPGAAAASGLAKPQLARPKGAERVSVQTTEHPTTMPAGS